MMRCSVSLNSSSTVLPRRSRMSQPSSSLLELKSTQRRRYTTNETQSECVLNKLDGEEDQGIFVVTMQRERYKNALGRNMLQQLRNSIQQTHDDSAARVLLLHSTVPKTFCAGADLKERATMSSEEAESFVNSLRSTFSELEALPIPTIAAIDGVALGGGLELALACDLRVAGGNSVMGLPETGLAIIPGAGGTQRLPRVVGVPKAKEMIFTGRRLNNKEAESMGVVHRAVDGDAAYSNALSMAREIASKGPVAIRAAKESIVQGSQVSMAEGMEVERRCYDRVLQTSDRTEALAAFKEKRKPNFKGQ
eukprot:gb/GECH01012854.1/.p1 GENE.gb/GECH01012854.1/~~gb/GECH01012854.1/.p1  ORF type:complete len:308 (+),score=87.41 gb/GECH01012854.1/:1-924(+)